MKIADSSPSRLSQFFLFNLTQHLHHHLSPDPKPIHKLLPVVNADKFDLSALILVKQFLDLWVGVQQLRLGSYKCVHRFLIFLAGIAVCSDWEQISIIHLFNDIHSYSPCKIYSEMPKVRPLFVHYTYENL